MHTIFVHTHCLANKVRVCERRHAAVGSNFWLALRLRLRLLGEQSQFYSRCGRTCARPTSQTELFRNSKYPLKKKQRQIPLTKRMASAFHDCR